MRTNEQTVRVRRGRSITTVLSLPRHRSLLALQEELLQGMTGVASAGSVIRATHRAAARTHAADDTTWIEQVGRLSRDELAAAAGLIDDAA
ncbi:hypothetical protein KV102_14205 [Mumia sp. zg.B53]|uniref:hypothetical protein n=1 Tax=unclassified Mumia TaxID=2621872 RepID=UPI001C6E6772|nr:MULTISPECIES: hypothetical protein [unclassified Mumia]MBW9205962.1 hypothetical protein [Mumia sp. zg.B17]MBW9208034.1 hypothetical protein [Mumia sp. zg.B21]MBW9215988.1 hypothetical protein [Mumia sp. zg.B53]MDD9349815.1 hypothetical protein [Mumia sp.]